MPVWHRSSSTSVSRLLSLSLPVVGPLPVVAAVVAALAPEMADRLGGPLMRHGLRVLEQVRAVVAARLREMAVVAMAFLTLWEALVEGSISEPSSAGSVDSKTYMEDPALALM